MGRMTRSKATEIAETMHIDEDAVLDLPSDAQENTKPSVSEAEERPALSELAPNSTSSKQSEDTQAGQHKPAKGKKGGKKGTKGSKKDATGFGMSTSVLADAPLEVITDEVESVPSPASKAASDDLVKDLPECKCLRISTYPPRGHMTLMQGCACSGDVSSASPRYQTQHSTFECSLLDEESTQQSARRSRAKVACRRQADHCGRSGTSQCRRYAQLPPGSRRLAHDTDQAPAKCIALVKQQSW